MLRAQFHSNQRIALVRTPIPTPGPGEVLVRVAACCVCGSDLRTFVHGNARVQNGATLGHELAGTIAEVGSGVSGWSVGDRVAVGADVPCE
jgi:L-iditol 2-dehydrogenase